MIRGIISPTNHVAFLQRRDQLGGDIEVEHLAVHCTVDDPRRVQPIMAEGSDQGLRAPVAEGRMIDQALSARCPAGGLGHVGLYRGFVDEGQPFEMVGHEGLALRDPDMAQVGHVPALLFKRTEVFFCVTGQAGAATAPPRSDAP